MDNGKIAAYLSLLPIEDEVFKSIVSGDLIESQVSADNILRCDAPGNYKLLLSAIVVAPEYKGINFVTVLYRALKRKITGLEHKGIISTDVYRGDSEYILAEVDSKSGAYREIRSFSYENPQMNIIDYDFTDDFKNIVYITKKGEIWHQNEEAVLIASDLETEKLFVPLRILM